MDRTWAELTDHQKKLVRGLTRSTRANAPMMVAWLNKNDAQEGGVWDSIDLLADLFERNWKR